jgi:hypothetical protein
MTVTATEDVRNDNSGADGADKSRLIVKIGSREYSLAAAEALCQRQATGFYWIAGLSLINMISLASNWDFRLYLGLGVTELIQGIGVLAGKDQYIGLMLAFYAVALAVLALFVFFGWRARQIKRWPFVLGMALYAADSVIYLAFQDFVGFGLHVFWLVFLWLGLRAVGPVQDARRRLASAST